MTNDQLNEIARAAFERYNGRPHPWEGAQGWVLAAMRDAVAQSRKSATACGQVDDAEIRSAFLANGFTIKPGQDDLKPYVYAAARALLAMRQPVSGADGLPDTGLLARLRIHAEDKRNTAFSRSTMREVIQALDRGISQPQPSGNTAEMDERQAFEHWAGIEYRHAGSYSKRDYSLGFSAWQARAAQASPEPRLDQPAKVSNARFGVGVKWSIVIAAAQRHYKNEVTPKKEAERIANGRAFLAEFLAEFQAQAQAGGRGDADPTPRDQYRSMYRAACADLGRINEALGLDPDDGGADPIIDAIEQLRAPGHPESLSEETLRVAGAIADKIEDGSLFRAGIYSNAELAEAVRKVRRAASSALARDQVHIDAARKAKGEA